MSIPESDIINVSPKPLNTAERLYIPAAFKGLGTTLRHLFGNVGRDKGRNVWVVQYPEQKRDDRDVLDGGQYRPTFRGVHRLNRDEDGRVRCVACFMCATACPANCIHIIADESPWEDREKYPKQFDIDELRCIYCGMCEEACPCDAIELTPFYEVTGLSRNEMVFDKQKLLEVYDQTIDEKRCSRESMHDANDAIDPSLIPRHTIPASRDSTATIPAIGLGTFGSDAVSPADVAQAVRTGLQLGYRHIDCAAVYGNEPQIGIVLDEAIRTSISRDDLWFTSKLWNDRHDAAGVRAACEQSLRDLRLDALDLYLVHWPFRNTHPPGCDGDTRSDASHAYRHGEFMETWGEMERLVERGDVRHIGTSNMSIAKLDLLLRDARIRPAANQMELHPHFQQPALFGYLREHDIVPIGYSPIGSPGRPSRDRTPDDSAPMDDPAIIEIAERLEMHPATVCLKWAAQRGQIPIPFSTSPVNLRANLESLTTTALSDDDMAAVTACDRACRLIKGQVFLWRDGQDWRDLWDEDGSIVST